MAIKLWLLAIIGVLHTPQIDAMPQNNQWRRTAHTDPVYALTEVYSGKLSKHSHFFIQEITTRVQSSLLDGTTHYLCSRCLRAIEEGRQCQRGYGCNRNKLASGGAAATNGPALASNNNEVVRFLNAHYFF